MRSLLLAILVAGAGCHGSKQTGPAWPAPSTTADDGGESIAPRETSVAAAVESSDEKDEPVATAAAAEPAKSAATPDSGDKPATVSAPTQPATDDLMISEEIIIEIDD